MSKLRKSWIGFWVFLAVLSFIWGDPGAWMAALFFALLGLSGLAKSNRDKEIAAHPDFTPKYKFEKKKSYLALDPASRKVAMWSGDKIRFFEGKDIVSVDIEKDGQTFSTSEHGVNISVLGGALGALLAGPVGMLIGGVSGASSATRSHETVSRLGVLLTVNDPDDPIFEMLFFQSSKPAPAGSASVKAAAKEMGVWVARLKSISHR